MPPNYNQSKNALLSHMVSTSRFGQFLSEFTEVSLHKGQILYGSGIPAKYAYFPTDSVISLFALTEMGGTVETAVIGKEGILGICLVMGSSTTNSAVVQKGGKAYRVCGKLLQRKFEEDSAFQRLLLFYTQVLITQMGQTALCNRYHRIEQQLCRWLLMMLDRVNGNQIIATHEMIATGLGVRREGISEAAKRLQDVNLIQYTRGCISILDRKGLEAMACECYGVILSETNRLFPLEIE